jgi:putative ATP-dependent endonuclease of OLD family
VLETFDSYSNEVSSLLFFADKVLLVEGESEQRVLKLLLEKKLGAGAHRISIISSSGNQNFSPFLRMIRSWNTAKIPHLVVTDFDSLTASTDRAVFVGAKAAGYTFAADPLYSKVDAVLDKGEAEFSVVAAEIGEAFKASGLNVFIFTSDLENSLITAANKDSAAAVLSEAAPPGVDYRHGYDLNALKRLIGSKGVPLNPMNQPPFKKPFVHRKIANTIDLKNAHGDITRLLEAIEAL